VSGREHDHSFDAFGTCVRVLVRSSSSATVAAPLAAVRTQALFRRMHRTLTRFEENSELSRLNGRACDEVQVSPTVLRAVEAALWVARFSEGLVDPTLIGELERAGYANSRAGLPPAPLAEALAAAPPRQPAGPSPRADWRRIQVDPHRRTVRLPRGVRIDLGGSAKGLAVDLAAELLSAHPAYAVDAGGDIRVGGKDAAARAVLIAHPLCDEIAHTFMIAAGAVATSGLGTRIWRNEDGFAHHLIDPFRGTPAWTGVIQATAIASTALEAEALAKTAVLRGPLGGRDVLARQGGALVLDDGEVVFAGDLQPALTEPALAA
jgi:thiamine biosynthesis lipoprotein